MDITILSLNTQVKENLILGLSFYDTDRTVEKDATKFTPDDIQADYSSNRFGSLVKDPYKYTLFDGQPRTSDFCFAIGMYCDPRSTSWINKGVPGFCEAESRVRLFARVDSVVPPLTNLMRKIFCTQNICYHSHIIQELLLSLYIYISI